MSRKELAAALGEAWKVREERPGACRWWTYCGIDVLAEALPSHTWAISGISFPSVYCTGANSRILRKALPKECPSEEAKQIVERLYEEGKLQ